MLRAARPGAPAAPQTPQGAPAPQAQFQAAPPQFQAPAQQAAPAPQAAAPQYQAPAPTPAPAAAPAPAPAAAPQYQAPQYQDGQPQFAAQPQYQEQAAPQYQAQPQYQAEAAAPQFQAEAAAPQYQEQNAGVYPVAQQPSYAPATTGNGGAVADLNAGILENMDGVGNIGNFVTLDGSEFLYKSSDRRAQYLDVNVHYGKRFYQWVDETNPNAKVYHNSDTKLDERYKLKMEIRWYEPGEDGVPVEYIMSLGTTSAIQFLDFCKSLAKAGLGVGQVWTRMTISRHNRPNSSDRYSRVDFEAFNLTDGQPVGVKSNG